MLLKVSADNFVKGVSRDFYCSYYHVPLVSSINFILSFSLQIIHLISTYFAFSRSRYRPNSSRKEISFRTFEFSYHSHRGIPSHLNQVDHGFALFVEASEADRFGVCANHRHARPQLSVQHQTQRTLERGGGKDEKGEDRRRREG